MNVADALSPRAQRLETVIRQSSSRCGLVGLIDPQASRSGRAPVCATQVSRAACPNRSKTQLLCNRLDVRGAVLSGRDSIFPRVLVETLGIRRKATTRRAMELSKAGMQRRVPGGLAVRQRTLCVSVS